VAATAVKVLLPLQTADVAVGIDVTAAPVALDNSLSRN